MLKNSRGPGAKVKDFKSIYMVLFTDSADEITTIKLEKVDPVHSVSEIWEAYLFLKPNQTIYYQLTAYVQKKNES